MGTLQLELASWVNAGGFDDGTEQPNLVITPNADVLIAAPEVIVDTRSIMQQMWDRIKAEPGMTTKQQPLRSPRTSRVLNSSCRRFCCSGVA